MVKQFGRLIFIASTIVFLFGMAASAQTAKRSKPHIGLPQDWTQHHMIFTDRTNRSVSAAQLRDPRAISARLIRARAHQAIADSRKGGKGKQHFLPHKKAHIDWSVDLHATMAPNTFPAKYTFDAAGAPDCTNDYVVYGLNTPGISTQANLVGLNDLYSGTTPVVGLCNGVDGNGASAKVYWAYAVPNAIQTSTVLSLDGKKVAFLEGGVPATFHVLAWKPNDGAVASPGTVDATTSAPVAGTHAQMTSLPLTIEGLDALCNGFASSISSPFIDYDNDVAYVGNDNGCLYRIKDVFCTTPNCVANPVAPSFDTGFLLGGAYPLGASAQLGSPIYDAGSGTVFVGSSNGREFGVVVSTQQQIPESGSQIGTPPNESAINIIVDSFNHFIYFYVGNGDSMRPGQSIVIQADTLSPLTENVATVGTDLAGIGPVYIGGFDDAYFSDPDPSNGHLYLCNYDAAGAPVVYRIGFDGSRNLALTSDASLALNGGTPTQCAGSMTEFLGQDSVDRLFFSLASPGSVNYVDISNGGLQPGTAAAVPTPGGSTGIVVDGASAVPQASSIYFMELSGTHAVKLTQAGLQ